MKIKKIIDLIESKNIENISIATTILTIIFILLLKAIFDVSGNNLEWSGCLSSTIGFLPPLNIHSFVDSDGMICAYQYENISMVKILAEYLWHIVSIFLAIMLICTTIISLIVGSKINILFSKMLALIIFSFTNIAFVAFPKLSSGDFSATYGFFMLVTLVCYLYIVVQKSSISALPYNMSKSILIPVFMLFVIIVGQMITGYYLTPVAEYSRYAHIPSTIFNLPATKTIITTHIALAMTSTLIAPVLVFIAAHKVEASDIKYVFRNMFFIIMTMISLNLVFGVLVVKSGVSGSYIMGVAHSLLSIVIFTSISMIFIATLIGISKNKPN
jgi:hypothetical protein